mmetsp:Transcript_32837/g.68897  ORF Transcript_32837/g.68897 Transcript_32837/m.68897 type:complete len:83 (+) Transcript_32837:49-297(+)
MLWDKPRTAVCLTIGTARPRSEEARASNTQPVNLPLDVSASRFGMIWHGVSPEFRRNTYSADFVLLERARERERYEENQKKT